VDTFRDTDIDVLVLQNTIIFNKWEYYENF
jgi:hypothetical protein